MKNNARVAIVVLNWNGWRDTLECLASLEKLNYPNYEVVVVDNGSTDGSQTMIRDAYPGITVLEMGDNLGFAVANNYAIRYAINEGADFLWLLNNDTVVDTEALNALITEAVSDRRVGMVGSKIKWYYQPDTIGNAGGAISTSTARTWLVGAGEADVGQWDMPRDVDWVSGCSMLASKELVEDVGLLDRRFFLFFEETDWAIRARQKGWRVRYQPKSTVWHKVSSSVKRDSPNMVFHFARSSVLFAKKHAASRFLLSLGMTAVFWVLRPLLRGSLAAASAGVRGLISGLAEMQMR
jgi:GT2 family glycosyltransferase